MQQDFVSGQTAHWGEEEEEGREPAGVGPPDATLLHKSEERNCAAA